MNKDEVLTRTEELEEIDLDLAKYRLALMNRHVTPLTEDDFRVLTTKLYDTTEAVHRLARSVHRPKTPWFIRFLMK